MNSNFDFLLHYFIYIITEICTKIEYSNYVLILNTLQAEVQNVFSDGSLSLHTRSLKYGKVSHCCWKNCILMGISLAVHVYDV